MSNQNLRKSVLCMALGLCLSSMALQPLHAQNTTGSVVGRADAGAQITVSNPQTGFSRTVTADAEGNYRVAQLPPGNYTVQASRGGSPVGTAIPVTVNLGSAANVDATIDASATTLGAIEVIGRRVVTAVDVTSTESATNITRDEYTRLPVDQSASAVALLAPGLLKGDSAISGISFGGSSAAENTFYINGLNVSDFNSQLGFSSVPFNFYKEFQVKTGGYSVEFGRSTGGVINAVTRSGSNEFEYGAELLWEPSSLQASAQDRYFNGTRYRVSRFDQYNRTNLNLFASGPIIKDRLFFFAMYEVRDFRPENTNNSGNIFNDGDADDGFWGAKLDWQLNDRHLLEFLAFSDQNERITDVYNFNPDTGERLDQTNTLIAEDGGKNWAFTYTGSFTDNFSMKALYGQNDRNIINFSPNDGDCNRIVDNRPGFPGEQGCTTTTSVIDTVHEREAARLDFEWALGDHLIRFGADREVKTSDVSEFYPGTNRLRYEVNRVNPTSGGFVNGVFLPAGTPYVRTRQLEVNGSFETLNTAFYIEDNWSITQNVVLNLGLRREAFDNKNPEGDTYIKIDDMYGPRLGLSWDVNGDARTKVFGNLGRYFLPIPNVINIRQAGNFLDERTFYFFNGYEPFEYNGQTYNRPILGAQIGDVDNSQGDGTVGDLRGEVDADMDPVYQDELILGFQSTIGDYWSWGLRGIYRRLNNAIDDMEITSNGVLCDGEPGYIGYVMANPGKNLTIYTDTNCDGVDDGYVDIDTSRAGWALYDDDGNYVGERGWVRPKRSYKALELVVDRAWDERWTFNGSYTLSYSRGNFEGPVNSDTNFPSTNRTEHFDDPFVNLNGYGPLPNDRRHQFKFRGAYALNENWQVGATLNVQSGRPISAFGTGNPFDGSDYFSFYICEQNCDSENPSERVYRLSPRGSYGTMGWTYDLGTSLTYLRSFGDADLRVKLAVYNVFNQQRTVEIEDEYETIIGSPNELFLRPEAFQSPRYGQLTVSLNF